MTRDRSRLLPLPRGLPLGAILCVAFLAGLAWLLRRGGDEPEPEAVPVVAAGTARARLEDFPITLVALGTVTPGPGAEARPAAPAPTRVARVLVARGDAVRAGQPLVALDVSVFAVQLEQAEAALAAARERRSRLERLVAQGIAPRKDLESARAEQAAAEASLAEARRNRDLGTVRSPIPGIVTDVAVTVGQPVEASQPLVDVVDPARLTITLRVSPRDAGRISRGAAVTLTASASERAGEPLARIGSGTVTGISASVDSATGSVAVVVKATNANRLLAGESLAGRITVGTRPHAVVVPLTALVSGDEGLHVFVVDRAGIAHETPVVVGERSDTDAEIISGLKGGELVVTEGAYGVSDGARIDAGPKRDGPAEPGT